MSNLQTILRALSIADAFGAGVEFQDRDWIRENVDFTRFVNARDQIKNTEKIPTLDLLNLPMKF